jgi:hypothetical protein
VILGSIDRLLLVGLYRRSDLMSRSAHPFCQGDRDAIGRSRMPSPLVFHGECMVFRY